MRRRPWTVPESCAVLLRDCPQHCARAYNERRCCWWGLRTFDMPMAAARNAREGQFTAVYVYDGIFQNKAGLGQAAVILTIILVVLTQIVTRLLRRLRLK